MSTFAAILLGVVIGKAAGFTLATLLLRKQLGNRITYEIGKLRAKKGGVIDVDQDNATQLSEPRKRKRRSRRSRRSSK